LGHGNGARKGLWRLARIMETVRSEMDAMTADFSAHALNGDVVDSMREACPF
jgi:hypothetical protein